MATTGRDKLGHISHGGLDDPSGEDVSSSVSVGAPGKKVVIRTQGSPPLFAVPLFKIVPCPSVHV